MSLSAVLSNAISGLAVAQNALGVTRSNVANVNTEGYTRKLAQQEAVVIDGAAPVRRRWTPTRAVDEFVTPGCASSRACSAAARCSSELHDQIQDRLFGAPGDADRGLTNLIGRVAARPRRWPARPMSAALAAAFLGAAQDLGGRLGECGRGPAGMRGDADQRIAGTTASINAELRVAGRRQRSDRPRRRRRRPARSPRPAAGRASRPRSSLPSTRQDDGTVAVYTRTGQVLLDRRPASWSTMPAATVGAGTSFGPIRMFRADEIDPATGVPPSGATGAVLVPGGVRAELHARAPGRRRTADATPADRLAVAGRPAAGPARGPRPSPARARRPAGRARGLAGFALNAAHNAAVPYPPPGQLVGTRTDTGSFAAPPAPARPTWPSSTRAPAAAVATLGIDVAAATDAAGARRTDRRPGSAASARPASNASGRAADHRSAPARRWP